MKKSNIILLIFLATIVVWLTGMVIVARVKLKNYVYTPNLEHSINLQKASIIKINGNGYVKIEPTEDKETLSGSINDSMFYYVGDTLVLNCTTRTQNIKLTTRQLKYLETTDNIEVKAKNVNSADSLCVVALNNSSVKTFNLNYKFLNVLVKSNAEANFNNKEKNYCEKVKYSVQNNGNLRLYGFRNIETSGKISNNGKFNVR